MWRGSWLIAALFAAACVETIPLGNECSDQRERCIVAPDAGVPSAPVGTRPPRTMDAGPRPPAPVTRDAGATPAPVAADPPPRLALFPSLDNTSFEALGEPGSLTSPEDDRTLPWVACRIGWNVVERAYVQAPNGDQMVTVLPTAGDTFMEYVRSAADQPTERAPLSQLLDVPLQAGQRYALRMDVQSSADVNVSLELWSGGSEGCEPAALLASSGRIAWGRWQSVCVAFDAPAAASVGALMLMPNYSEVPNSGTRVFVDNVRPDPTCQ